MSGTESQDLPRTKDGGASPLKMSLALTKTADVATQVRFKPASAGQGNVAGGSTKSAWGEAWRDGGRATFRPSTSEKGRPSFKNDKEDVTNEMRELKMAFVQAEKEKEGLKVKIHKLEVRGREKDRVVAQALMERSNELPERIQSLIKECVSSSSLVEIENLKNEVTRKNEQIESLKKGENTDSNRLHHDSSLRGTKDQRSIKPWDLEEDKILDSPVAKSGRKVQMAGGGGKGGEALTAARGEIERLQKLYNAGEVVREGLERRIAELEAEVQRLRARAVGDPNSPVKDAQVYSKSLEVESDQGQLFTKDGRDFENYIRKLAGLAEIAGHDKGDKAGERIRVGLGPKPTGKDRSSAASAAELASRKKNREWVMYEVTTQTSKVSGAGTTSQCYVTFRGEYGDYGPCLLERPEEEASKPSKALAEGSRDVFDVCALDVGPLESIVVSHDNSGISPSWHVAAITVRRARTETQESKTYEFYYDGWISADKGDGSLRVEISLSSRQARGAGAQVMTVSSLAGASGRSPDGIDFVALGSVCSSVTQAILELHVPNIVASRQEWGLTSLARSLTSKPVRPPASCRDLFVLLVGPRTACTQFVEWFSGGKMVNAGMGTEASITVVCSGKRSRVESGDHAAGMAPHCESILSVPKIGKKFCVEEMAGAERRFDQITFIHPPAIEGSAKGADLGTSVSMALQELKGEFENKSNLKACFKEIDTDGSGSIDLKEFQAAMVKLGIDMPGPRAERLFRALDVSGEGSIEYEEFLGAFRPPRTSIDYDLEEALEAAAGRADLILCLMDPKSVHYNARELGIYKQLRSRHDSKMKLCAFLRDSVRGEPRLKSHILPETVRRLEEVFGIPPSSLPALETLFIPSDDAGAGAALTLVDNALDSIMLRFAQGLLELENQAVDETHDNLRQVLDSCFVASDSEALSTTKPKLSKWLKSFADALSRKKHPPAVKLHKSLVSTIKDLERGQLVSDDVEGWSPQQVGAWIKTKGTLSRYEAVFVDEGINGRKLVTLTEDSLKRKLSVQSLGHRKEIIHQIHALLEGRKNFLKH